MIRKTENRHSYVFEVFALILFTAAAVLTLYNLFLDYSGGTAAAESAEKIEAHIERVNKSVAEQPQEERTEPVTEENHTEDAAPPGKLMPEEVIDGISYIGLLEIEALSLKLPIISQWSYDALKIAPARYTGSVYEDNMVIAGHNYKSHFGSLNRLRIGDGVIFTDTDGNVYTYEVTEKDIIDPSDTEDMITGDWDLTLFTCTADSSYRVTIRCRKRTTNSE